MTLAWPRIIGSIRPAGASTDRTHTHVVPSVDLSVPLRLLRMRRRERWLMSLWNHALDASCASFAIRLAPHPGLRGSWA
jgi:hypothetical protein